MPSDPPPSLEDRIVCLDCWRDGRKSRITLWRYEVLASSTAPTVFVDEETGRLHVHSNACKRCLFTCTYGHLWEIEHRERCWCGWPYEEEPTK